MPDYEKEQNVSLEVILRKGDADTWSPRPMPSAIWSAWLLQFIGRTLTRRWKNFGLSSRPANSSPASRVCSHDIDAQMSVAPSTKIRWKVSPWHPRAHNPKYRIDESSIAICYPPQLPSRPGRCGESFFQTSSEISCRLCAGVVIVHLCWGNMT